MRDIAGQPDLDRIVEKVQKLFALGTSSNEHEAASAVAKAQSLMAAYDLSMESIDNLKSDPRTSIAKGGNVVKTTAGKPDGWKAQLFEYVARTSDCRTAYRYEYEETSSGRQRAVKHGYLIGFKHDVEQAGYAFSFLVGEIERLAQTYADVHWNAIRLNATRLGISVHRAESMYTSTTGTHPLKAKLYFTKGAAQTVAETLETEQRRRRDEAARDNPNAIVLQKGAAVRDFVWREAYGMGYDEWKATEAARRASYEPFAKEDTTEKPESPSAKRRREEAEARREQKSNEAYWRRYEREQAKIDHDALGAGQTAGRKIAIRPGVGASPEQVARIDEVLRRG